MDRMLESRKNEVKNQKTALLSGVKNAILLRSEAANQT